MENDVVESVWRQGLDNGRVTPRATGMHSAAALAGAVLLAAALVTAPVPSRAATYKWTDDNGVVHYTDKMPPEAVNKGTVLLNKQGVPIKKTDPALTSEQRRALEAEESRRREVAREEAEKARRDRALLSSYTTESEIDLARKRALSTIDGVVQSSRAYGDQLAKRKRDAEAKKASFGNGPVPPALERELEGINRELARQTELLDLKRREAEAVVAKYDAEKLRWRELIAAKGGLAPQAVQGLTPASGTSAAAMSGPPTSGATPAKR